MLVPVIMAGGVGSRLWPASREAFPKQFLSLQSQQSEGNYSLFQQSLLRLRGIPDQTPPVVVCNVEHRFLVAEQLRQLGIGSATIILEPVGRNTAPAVALAALAVEQRYPGAQMLVLAADHVIRSVPVFQQVISRAIGHASAGALVTFGIVPDRPETGYGYIQRGQPEGEGYSIARFVEKPDLETARAYLATGEYYWNSGMFMFGAARFLSELECYAPEIARVCEQTWLGVTADLDFLRLPAEKFAQCPADSIDYAVMENTGFGVVLPLDAGWNDLGAWSAVWEQGPQDEQGNVVLGDVKLLGTSNSFIHAGSRLVTLVGMDNAVVVETQDAILVADRNQVQEVKQIVKQLLAENRSEAVLHRRVYRPWGSYEGLAEEAGFQVKRIIVNPGASLSLQLHHKRAEHWIMVRGTATVTVGDRKFALHENESTYIPMNTRHRLENLADEPLTLIEVQCGSYLGEDDIVRFEDNYGRHH